CVFLLKFNYVTFWLGFLVAVAIWFVTNRKIGELFKHAGLFTAGFALTFLPYVVYALRTESLGAFFREYLFYNAAYAASVTPAVDPSLPLVKEFFGVGGFFFFIGCTLLPAITVITGSVFVLRNADQRFKLGYILSFSLLFLATYLARVFSFTSIPMTVFCLPGLIAITRYAERALPKLRLRGTVFMALASLAVFLYTVGDNNLVVFLALERTDGIPDFREEIAETVGEGETVLELMSLDSGIYTACGVIPETPHFYKPNIDHAVYPDALEAQYEVIANRETDYAVITLVDGKLLGAYSETEKRYKEKMLQTLTENYDFIDEYSATGFQAHRQYHLYRAKRTVAGQ
ncbi:MAG: hypothetical protein LBR72_01855, partial [Oscillospiraceae bacterium]|nr:hypothetical protein [Oscillospiraceae bacterium]